MTQLQERAPLNGLERFSVLLVPWTFIAVFCGLFVEVLLPRVREGHALAVIAGAFATFVVIVFGVAAVTFSRDILTGRWPRPQD